MPQSPNWKGWTGPYAMTRSQISEWDKKIALRVKESVERAAGKGLKAAVLFLAARIKEEVGLPAPRDRVPVPGGTFKYVARTKALRKAPPRKVSGALQRSVAGKMITPSKAVITVSAKSEKGFSYPKWHEMGRTGQFDKGLHPFALKTLLKYRKELERIIGQEFRSGR